MASSVWSIGDEKPLSISGVGSYNVIFSHYQGNRMYFTSKELLPKKAFATKSGFMGGYYPACYVGSPIESYLDGTVYTGLPQDLKNVIKTRSMTFCKGLDNGSDTNSSESKVCSLWIPFVGDLNAFTSGAYDKVQYENPIPMTYYSSDARRKKSLSGAATDYWTASFNVAYYQPGVYHITNDGDSGWEQLNLYDSSPSFPSSTPQRAICFGFCV